MTDEALFVSIPKAATRLGLSASTVRKMAKEGELPAVWIGRRLMVPTRPLEEWANKRIEEAS